MQLAAVALHLLHGFEECRIDEEAAVLDRGGDACELLQHPLARADIQVPHLGVAHLPLWQTYRRAGGRDLGMRPLALDAVQIRLRGQRDGVGVAPWVDAVAVHDDEDQWARHSRHGNKLSFALGCPRHRQAAACTVRVRRGVASMPPSRQLSQYIMARRGQLRGAPRSWPRRSRARTSGGAAPLLCYNTPRSLLRSCAPALGSPR